MRRISEPINQPVPSSKIFSWGFFWVKVLHGSAICFCFISTTIYVSDIFRLCTVKAGDVGFVFFQPVRSFWSINSFWLWQCLFGWIIKDVTRPKDAQGSFVVRQCFQKEKQIWEICVLVKIFFPNPEFTSFEFDLFLRNKSIGSIWVSPKSFFFCNHLSGARAKYVKTACVASAAVSSCKFQEAYKVDRELNEWKKPQYSYIPLTKVSLRVVSFWWVFFKSKGCIWEDKHMEFPTWWWWVLTTHNGESECGMADLIRSFSQTDSLW